MTAGFRLFAIDFRRNAGLWLSPVMLGLVLAISHENYLDGVILFSQALILLGPAAGGLAAWTAARDRRRGIEDLLATTPKPAPIRDLTLWAAASAWGLLPYLAATAYLLIATALAATPGRPVAVPILIGLGLLTIAADAALGYAIGAFVDSRYVVPLVPLALFLAHLIPAEVFETVTVNGIAVEMQNLSTLEALEDHRVPGIAALHGLMLLGLTGVALAVVVVRRRRTRPAWGILIAAAVAMAVGATLLLRAETAASPPFTDPAPGDSVCAEAAVPGCLSPAHAAVLDETAARVDEIVRPVAGLPRAPTRAEQADPFGDFPVDILATEPSYPGSKDFGLAVNLVRSLVQAPPYVRGIPDGQSATTIWLLRRSARDDGPARTVPPPFRLLGPGLAEPGEAARTGILAAVDRFAILAPDEQCARPEDIWSDFRSGDLTLEDLP